MGLFVFQNDRFDGGSSTGIRQFDLGLRWNLIEKADGWIPSFAIQGRLKVHEARDEYRLEDMKPTAILTIQHQLHSQWVWTNNLGIDYSRDTSAPTHLWVTNLGYSLNDTWGTFIEAYGFEQAGRDSQFVDLGVSYLANNNLQWDIFAGGGKNFGVEDRFISFGVSWRVSVLDRNPVR